MTSDQKRPPPTHGTRAAIMSPGLNAAAQSGSYGRGIRRGLPAVEVYRPSRFTGRSGLPTSDPVSASARFTGQRSCLLVIDRQGLPAVQVYRPATSSPGRQGLPAIKVHRPATLFFEGTVIHHTPAGRVTYSIGIKVRRPLRYTPVRCTPMTYIYHEMGVTVANRLDY